MIFMLSSKPVYYIDRKTNTKKKEAIYGGTLLSLLYANNIFSKLLSYAVAHITLISRFYGFWQKMPYTKKNIAPFVAKFNIDYSEFEKSLDQFSSFNDFFCRKLKKNARPLSGGQNCIVAPADGRYLVIPQISTAKGFYIKGHTFSLETLLQDTSLAQDYQEGSMVIARLCPTDYHRFHFPIEGEATTTKLINGPLFSVNPIAAAKNVHIFSENKRMITLLENTPFDTIVYIEVGATNVGSIIQTYTPNSHVNKGDEKGFFSFGGSSLILLFKPNTLLFDQDLINNSSQHLETLILMGSSLGRLKNS